MINKILNKRYKILSEIGSGGMAIVYKAFDAETSSTVAVKVLRPELVGDEQLLKRFRREAIAASSLNHPNIVKLLDVGCDDTTQYIVLDYIEGITLKKYIEEKKQLSPKEAAEIALQIAKGLSHAHSNAIIHRDIKPHNIIIQDDGTVKIMDFGIARIVSEATRTTKFGADLIGTVYYSSPEQIKGKSVDAATDIYSLGVVMYEMVTGLVPFDGETVVSIAMQQVSNEAEPTHKYNEDVPETFENIIRTAMAKDKNSRYKSIDDMITDLQLFIDGKLTLPIPNIPVIRPPKKAKKVKSEEEKKKDARYLNSILLNTFLVLVLATLFCLLAYGVFRVGSMIYENNFVISKVQVPNIIGKSEEEAKALLMNKRLIYRSVSSSYSSTVPAGHVIEQTPASGETANEDDLVDVVLSLGAFLIDVPNFVGRDIVSAEYDLRSNQYIKVGKYNYVESATKKDTILGQSIPAGSLSLDGNYVTIIFDISSGPATDKIEVKKLVGFNLTNALQIAKIYNMSIGEIKYEYSSTVKKGVVISQSIPEGITVDKGQAIDIVVSQGEMIYTEQTITVSLPENILPDENGLVDVNFQIISDGRFVDAYNGKAEVNDSVIEVKITDIGTYTYYIYVNNKFIESRTVVFSD